MDDIVEKVAHQFGLACDLKKEQKAAISSILSGKDTFVVLPTGFGKSLCFQSLPVAFDLIADHTLDSKAVVIVVSPLIAIMKDQVFACRELGVAAGYLCGENDDYVKDFMDGNLQLVYFTPELLLKSRRYRSVVGSKVYQQRIKALAIDEAHTIKKWGSTFREELMRIGELRNILPPGIPVMALTATAPHALRLDLSRIIGMKEPTLIIVPPCKDNLKYYVKPFESLEENLKESVMQLRSERTNYQRTIIYCRTMEDCANVYLFYQSQLGEEFVEPIGAPFLSRYRLVELFTSCTDESVKTQIISSFTKPSCLRIVCATVAFGMGINCTDVRVIMHIGPPDDIEGYIQETGRAGRDNMPASAILYVKKRLGRSIEKEMREYCSSENCRRHFLFSKLEGYKHKPFRENCCNICDKQK